MCADLPPVLFRFPFFGSPPPLSAPACPVPPVPPQRSLHCQLAIPSPTHNRIFFCPIRLASLPLVFFFLFSVLSPPFQLPLALCLLCPPTLSQLKLAVPSCTREGAGHPFPNSKSLRFPALTSSLHPLTTCVPLYVALCLLLMSSRSDRTPTPKSGCPTPVTVALSSLHSGECPSFPPSPLTPPLSLRSPPGSTGFVSPSLAVPHLRSAWLPLSYAIVATVLSRSRHYVRPSPFVAAGRTSVLDPLLYSTLDYPSPTPSSPPSSHYARPSLSVPPLCETPHDRLLYSTLTYPSPTPSSPRSRHYVRPSPFVPPLWHTARSLAVGSAALPLSGDVTLFCPCRQLVPHVLHTTPHTIPSHFVGYLRVFRRPLPTLSCRMLPVAPASFGDCSPHYSVAVYRLVPGLWKIVTCARRCSFHLSCTLLAPLLWGGLHCHSPVTSHYSVHVVGWLCLFQSRDHCPHDSVAFHQLVPPLSETAAHMTLLHVVGWFRLFRRPLPTRFRRISSICSASLGDCLLLSHLLAVQQMSGCTVCHAYCSKLTPLHVCYVTPRDNA